MKALLIDRSPNNNLFQHQNLFTSLSMAVINKPLLVHQIEKLKECGIDEILVLTSQKVPKELADGKRWDIQLEFKETVSVNDDFPSSNDLNIFILPANIIVDLDFNRFLNDHHQSNSVCSIAKSGSTRIAAFGDYFNPLITKTGKLTEIFGEGPGFPPDYFSQKMLNDLNSALTLEYDFNIYYLNSYQDYWKLHQNILKTKLDTASCPGFPLSDNFWVDVGTRVHPHTETDGIIIVGKNCKIHKDVSLKGFVVIGDNVVVDSRVGIQNSVIMNNTYIGTDIRINNSVVNKTFLFQADKNLGMVIDENFIISETGWGMQHLKLRKWMRKYAG